MVKDKESGNEGMFAPIVNALKENILGALGKMVSEKIRKIEKIGAELVMSFLFFVFGALFLLIALVFFVKEYLKMDYFVGFLCAGILAMLIAFIAYEFAKKN